MKKKMTKTAKPIKKSYLANQFDLKHLNQVTTVSKVLAAILFIILPCLAFMIGLIYQNSFSIIQ